MQAVHSFLETFRRAEIAKLPGGLIDYATPQKNLSVVAIDSKDDDGARVYSARLESGEMVKLESASTFARKWKGSHYFGASDAARIGTDVHHRIEEYFAGSITWDSPPHQCPVVNHCFGLFEDWWSGQYHLQVAASECVVWSLVCGLAGRLDILFRNTELPRPLNVVEMIDFKTTDTVSDQYRIQQAVYAICLESVGVRVDRCALLLLPKPAQGSEWKEVVLWDSTEQGQAKFQNLRMAVLTMIQTESYLKAQKDGCMSASTANKLIQAFVSLSCVNPAPSNDTETAMQSGPSQSQRPRKSEVKK